MRAWKGLKFFCFFSLVLISGCTDHESDSAGSDTDTDADADTDTTTDSNPDGLPVITDVDIETIPDPYGNTPLVGIVAISHESLVPKEVHEIHVLLEGIDEQEPGLVEYLYPGGPEFETNFNVDDIVKSNQLGIPVLGLHTGENNQISFRVYTDSALYVGETVIWTPSLDFEEEETISVEVFDEEALEPGFMNIHSRIYDHYGNCRWHSSNNIHDILSNGLFLDSSKIDTWNLLGRQIINRSDDLPKNFETHHAGIELSSGNIVACVSNSLTSIVTSSGAEVISLEDYVIELDYESSVVVNAWDMREFLDVDRQTVYEQTEDWLHMNMVYHDEFDDSLIMSGRYQGIFKVTRNGIQGEEANQGKDLVWILAPHLDWGMAGWDGKGDLDPNDYLLTAVDSNGIPYDEDVQNNLAPPSDDLDEFHWPAGQHGLQITYRDGDKLRLLVFNNQASVIFDGPGTTDNLLYGDPKNDRSAEPYSLMIEYEIDEQARTVRQHWSYGHEMPEYYCSYRSGVDLCPHTQNRLLYSCGIDRTVTGDEFNPHVVEVEEQGDVLYHLEITDTELALYRSMRVDLYHPSLEGN